MDVQPMVTYRNMPPSASIDERIRERIEKLERVCGHMIGCRVAVEAPHRHHRQGKLFRERVQASLPGEQIVAGRDRAEHQAHEDVYVALRYAFDAVERRLEDHMRRRRGAVKAHAPRRLERPRADAYWPYSSATPGE